MSTLSLKKTLKPLQNVFSGIQDLAYAGVPIEKNPAVLGEMLYTAYYTRIHRYFSFRIFDKYEADYLAQTVFLKIFASLKSGLWEGTGGICYIFTVARNTLIDYFRKNKHASIASDTLVDIFSDSVSTV